MKLKIQPKYALTIYSIAVEAFSPFHLCLRKPCFSGCQFGKVPSRFSPTPNLKGEVKMNYGKAIAELNVGKANADEAYTALQRYAVTREKNIRATAETLKALKAQRECVVDAIQIFENISRRRGPKADGRKTSWTPKRRASHSIAIKNGIAAKKKALALKVA
jgi:hypothetical protein